MMLNIILLHDAEFDPTSWQWVYFYFMMMSMILLYDVWFNLPHDVEYDPTVPHDVEYD